MLLLLLVALLEKLLFGGLWAETDVLASDSEWCSILVVDGHELWILDLTRFCLLDRFGIVRWGVFTLRDGCAFHHHQILVEVYVRLLIQVLLGGILCDLEH